MYAIPPAATLSLRELHIMPHGYRSGYDCVRDNEPARRFIPLLGIFNALEKIVWHPEYAEEPAVIVQR